MEANDRPSAEQWQEATAKPMDMGTLDALVQKMVQLWDVAEALRKEAAEARAKAEVVDQALIQALRDAGKTKYFVDGVGTISIVPKFQVCLPATMADKEKLFAYLQAQGHDVYMDWVSVNSSTLNARYTAKAEEAAARGEVGFSIPGIAAPTTRQTLRFTQAKKGSKL